ncbi:vacuole membrane protein KMS1-like [Aristolochia californica]|uniref:vacuole membrane protein KMS1-like n=1 Tax=Aristolochia californica TaxID=171875 RepID=UPI0035E332B0
MGIRKKPLSPASHKDVTNAISSSGLEEKHRVELENLTLMTQPFKTMKFFILASVQYLKRSVLYLLSRGVWLMLLGVVSVASGLWFIGVGDAYEKHIQEILSYLRFVVWWVALGVASSIGLGSGLHTFVLYLGPHIALFTIKAMQCGRVDLKAAPYDTIQLERGPSWLDKACSEFGPPVFPSLPDSLVRVPLSSILPQVQLEAILWGVGTALGELPPYFISRAARLSGRKMEGMEDFDASSKDAGTRTSCLSRLQHWLFSHSQHLDFFTILILASVPNPLFDLAGIMCGQFGIPFWEFFLATLTGKALIKAHIQTVFIISVCNNQLLEWIENEVIWMFGHIPGLASILPNLISKLHKVKEKYLTAHVPSPTIKAKKWSLSWSSIWSTVVWLMLFHFFIKIVNSTAQRFLSKKQELELAALSSSSSRYSGEGPHTSEQ